MERPALCILNQEFNMIIYVYHQNQNISETIILEIEQICLFWLDTGYLVGHKTYLPDIWLDLRLICWIFGWYAVNPTEYLAKSDWISG